VEVAEREENGFELRALGGLVDCLLTKLVVASSQVGLEILWSLVGDLDGGLEDRLGDDVHVG
jgi:hypothetical protein